MPTGITLDHIFADLSGDNPASDLDDNFNQLADALNSLNSFNAYLLDTGAVNALAVSVSSPIVVSYGAGLLIQVKVANTNTGGATIDVNSLGAVSIVNAGGAALAAGQLQAGSIAALQYDGTNFELIGGAISSAVLLAMLGLVAASQASTPNTLAERTSSSYLYAQNFNQASADNENPTIGQIFVENSSADGFLRKAGLNYAMRSGVLSMTIESDPGGTPSGSPGQLFFYY